MTPGARRPTSRARSRSCGRSARRRLYWTARAVFVSDPAQVDGLRRGLPVGLRRRGPRRGRRARRRARPSPAPRGRPAAAERTGRAAATAAPSRARRAAGAPRRRGDDEDAGARSRCRWRWRATRSGSPRKSFDALEPHELAQLYRLMSRLRLATPRAAHAPLRDGAATASASTCAARCARSLRTGGDPIRLARRRRRVGAAAARDAAATSRARWSPTRAPTCSS